MQREAKTAGPNRIADLRASLRAASDKKHDAPKPPKPPKARKNTRLENEDERIAKAEKAAMLQHTTSLLKDGNSKKPYVRKYEREERRSGGLFWQLLLVMIVAGGVACALDPSIIPHEWVEKARELASPYIKI